MRHGDVYANDVLIFAVRFMGGDNTEGKANGTACVAVPAMLAALLTAAACLRTCTGGRCITEAEMEIRAALLLAGCTES